MSGKSELRIFDEMPPQIVVESAHFQDIYPQSSVDLDTSDITFCIAGSQTQYLDLNDTLLSMKVSVRRSDGAVFTTADAVRPVPTNYFMNALFSDATLTLNDTQIEGGSSMYPYKSTIESILNFGISAAHSQLLTAGVAEEETERAKWVGDSGVFELVGALRLDFFNQPKYLIPGVNVRINLVRSQDSFSLDWPSTTQFDASLTFKVKIVSCVLYVRRVAVHPAVLFGHTTGLAKKNAIYPYNRTKLITYTIPKESFNFFKENLFSTAILPKFFVVGMVDSNAFTGKLQSSPFKFQHFNMSTMTLYRDGQSVPYKKGYEVKLSGNTKLSSDAYVRSILQNTGIFNKNIDNFIQLSDFTKGGFALYTFNLTPDFDMNQVQQVRDSNLRLDIRFTAKTTTSINVIVYGIFDAVVQVTKDRTIIKDSHE